MNRLMRSFVKGLILGCCGKLLQIVRKTDPVAYLYNGVQLPQLPYWDKETYPYAFIRATSSGAYYVWCGSDPAGIKVGSGLVATGLQLSVFAPCIFWQLVENGWLFRAKKIEVSGSFSPEQLAWSNYDILNEDGTVYLAASDPIPVYE